MSNFRASNQLFLDLNSRLESTIRESSLSLSLSSPSSLPPLLSSASSSLSSSTNCYGDTVEKKADDENKESTTQQQFLCKSSNVSAEARSPSNSDIFASKISKSRERLIKLLRKQRPINCYHGLRYKQKDTPTQTANLKRNYRGVCLKHVKKKMTGVARKRKDFIMFRAFYSTIGNRSCQALNSERQTFGLKRKRKKKS